MQRDERLVASHTASIQHSVVWPTYDFTHADESPPTDPETTKLAPRWSVAQFKIPEVHSVTQSGEGLIYTHKLAHNGQGQLQVPMTADGWLFCPCTTRISLVTPRGIVARDKMQEYVKRTREYAAFLEGGCPLVCVDW